MIIRKKVFRYLSMNELEKGLINQLRGLGTFNIEKLIEHERSHYKKALELGVKINDYELSFFSFMEIVHFGIRASMGIDISTKYEDVISIALAPLRPSKSDYALAKECGWNGEER
jgi:hypothetical protein